MRAGDLRRRITLQTRDTTRDSYGQQVTTWTDFMTGVPADIQSLAGRELLAAQATYSEATHLIVIRYMTLLSDPVKVAAMRAVYGNGGTTRYFNIGACQNIDERNKEMHLFVSEGLNQG